MKAKDSDPEFIATETLIVADIARSVAFYRDVMLALAGRRIQGRVVAERAGHAMHTALVQRLMRDRSAWELAHGYNEVAEPETAVGHLEPATVS